VSPEPSATVLLQRYGAGDRAAADALMPLLYDELRKVAAGHLRHERAGHTLQPTALVHEAWIRLVDDPARDVEGRRHFLGLAARVMRRVLVDHARERNALKRGGGAATVTLDDAVALYEQRDLDVTDLDDALSRLNAMDPQLARIVELRFFAGLTNEEVAVAEALSLRTVERAWSTARAWLRGELQESET
jgi:RNA polymerase sigma factor (TIGR02999 family)